MDLVSVFARFRAPVVLFVGERNYFVHKPIFAQNDSLAESISSLAV